MIETLTAASPSEVGLPRERLDRLREAAPGHFWHEPRQRLLAATIRDHLAPGDGPFVDVGCGSGALVDRLCRDGYDARGVDPWAEACGLRPPRFLTGTATDLPFADRSLAGVGAFDLLEHVDDDRGALSALRRVLGDRGLLVTSVPAWPSLWSTRDVLAKHRRRYRRRELLHLLDVSGFATERIFGYQFFLLPLLFASRLVERHRSAPRDTTSEDRPPRWLNRLLRSINRAEVAIGAVARPPIGSSWIAVARRRDDRRSLATVAAL